MTGRSARRWRSSSPAPTEQPAGAVHPGRRRRVQDGGHAPAPPHPPYRCHAGARRHQRCGGDWRAPSRRGAVRRGDDLPLHRRPGTPDAARYTVPERPAAGITRDAASAGPAAAARSAARCDDRRRSTARADALRRGHPAAPDVRMRHARWRALHQRHRPGRPALGAAVDGRLPGGDRRASGAPRRCATAAAAGGPSISSRVCSTSTRNCCAAAGSTPAISSTATHSARHGLRHRPVIGPSPCRRASLAARVDRQVMPSAHGA